MSQDLQAESLQKLYQVKKKCRMCGSDKLILYLDLGCTPPADQFRLPTEADIPEITYPLRVNWCATCGLSQLSHVVNPAVLYQHDYPYESSTTTTGKKHWDDFASKVAARLQLAPKSTVLDVGSNVGVLLDSFKALGMRVLGVDPAPNIVAIANERGVETISNFFGQDTVPLIKKRVSSVDVITGTNVFAHIDDLHDVMLAVKNLLSPQGVFIFESPYFQHLVDALEYDTIYHEHLSYLSVKPLIRFFATFEMELFAVEESSIHGGSMRVYVGKKGQRPIDQSVAQLLNQEERNSLHNLTTLRKFAERVQAHRTKLVWVVENLVQQGKTVSAVSAPAKGMTLLNYCGLTNRQIAFVSEKSRLKIGRLTPGGHIPIVSDEALLERQPDYALLLAWNFASEIMANLQPFHDRGGRFIIPIPEPTIV